MGNVLVLVYAVLSMSTTTDKISYVGEGMDEMERQVETGDDIRREAQEARKKL